MVRIMKPFEIFKTGKHTSSQGVTLSFSDADLADIAQNYDPANHQAPIVIGHPKQDAPAYGWIKGLSVRGGRLVAEPEQIDTAFSELVTEGRFKKVSAALYAPDQIGNPTPGKYHLRHVGFLGAEPPAVKGLKPIEFAAGDDFLTFAEIEFAEWRSVWLIESAGRIFRGIRDYFIETADLETADRIIPEWEIEQLTQSAADMRAELRTEEARPFFSETTPKETDMTTAAQSAATQADIDRRLAELQAREDDVKKRETEFAETARKTRLDEDATFVAAIVKEGRLPIGLQAAATALFSELNDGTLTFSEGDHTMETTPREAFRDLLQKLPVPVTTGEVATGDGPDFSDPAHVQVAIETEIREAKARGETISPATAAMRLQTRR